MVKVTELNRLSVFHGLSAVPGLVSLPLTESMAKPGPAGVTTELATT